MWVLVLEGWQRWRRRKRDGEGGESVRGGSETGEAFTEGHEGLLCQVRPRELRQLP